MIEQRLSRTETAALVGVSYNLIGYWNKDPSNDFPRPYMRVGRRLFYSKTEVLNWLSERVKIERKAQKAKRVA